MSSMATNNGDDSDDGSEDFGPMRLTCRPNGYRKTKKIHSLKKGKTKEHTKVLQAGNKLGHIQAAVVPGQREMHKLSRKLDKVVRRDEMESHLDSAFDVTKAKRYVALRDAQQRQEKQAWQAIKGNGTRVMCTWGEFVILQEELNDQEKMRNVAQLIVNCDKLEDEDPGITSNDGYDHYYKITSGQHELWMGRSSLMGNICGGVLDINGETNSALPFHRIVCQRHMCSLYPYATSDTKNKNRKNTNGKKKIADKRGDGGSSSSSGGMLASFVDDSVLDQLRKKDVKLDGDIFTMEDVHKGILLTPLRDKWDNTTTTASLKDKEKQPSKSGGKGSGNGGSTKNELSASNNGELLQAKQKHDAEMAKKRSEASNQRDPNAPRRRYLRWKALHERKNKPCTCHFSGCIMIKWTLEERQILKQRCGQKGLPPGFNDIVYRQNRYLTDPIALVLYQLCDVVREIHNAEEHVRKILGDLSIGSCMDLLEEVDKVRSNLDMAVAGPPPFKKHFDLARNSLKLILKSALEVRLLSK